MAISVGCHCGLRWGPTAGLVCWCGVPIVDRPDLESSLAAMMRMGRIKDAPLLVAAADRIREDLAGEAEAEGRPIRIPLCAVNDWWVQVYPSNAARVALGDVLQTNPRASTRRSSSRAS